MKVRLDLIKITHHSACIEVDSDVLRTEQDIRKLKNQCVQILAKEPLAWTKDYQHVIIKEASC